MNDNSIITATLAVNHSAIQSPFLRGRVETVDAFGMPACSAADEHWSSPGVVLGNSTRDGGGILSSLRRINAYYTGGGVGKCEKGTHDMVVKQSCIGCSPPVARQPPSTS